MQSLKFFMEEQMANKLYAMEQLTEEVAKDVASSPQEWMRFLDTASRLYRYTFPEQLLIYAQRPDATAVASMESGTRKMIPLDQRKVPKELP